MRQYAMMLVLTCVVSGIGYFVMRAAPHVERVVGLKLLPIWLREVLGAVFVAALASLSPQVLGAGHGALVLDLSRDMLPSHIALLIVLKLSACLISLASGFRGGLFF